jgi:hypothetical protein
MWVVFDRGSLCPIIPPKADIAQRHAHIRFVPNSKVVLLLTRSRR